MCQNITREMKLLILFVISVSLIACSQQKRETNENPKIQQYKSEIQKYQDEIKAVEQEYEEVRKNRPAGQNRTVPKLKAHFRKLLELEERRKELERKVQECKMKIRKLEMEK